MVSSDHGTSDLRRAPRVLGSLESRIMDQLWAAEAPRSVQEVVDGLGDDHNYKTVMTVLNRLVTKQLLMRELDGRAYRYAATTNRADFVRSVADEMVRSYEEAYGSDGMPHLVQAIGAAAPVAPPPPAGPPASLGEAEVKSPSPVAALLSAVLFVQLLRILVGRRRRR